MKKIQFKKTFSDGRKIEAEGYAYKTANGIDVALHKEGKAWYATEVTTGKLVTTKDNNLTLNAVKAEVEKNSPTVLKLLRKGQAAKQTKQKKERPMQTKKSKAKTLRPNPFAGAEVQDIYLTKSKFAVTTVKTIKKNNVNKTIVKTKYYKQNDANRRSLRKVKSEVRRGRNGGKYEKI